MLRAIEIPRRLYEIPVPAEVRSMIADLRCRIERFQDRWDVPQIEQFVAADYELVYQSLVHLRQTQVLLGDRFLEWGCGFAAVSVLAASLNFDALGVEAEPELLRHGRRTVADWQPRLGGHVELVAGDFLPPGTPELADDPTLPSLHHEAANVYESLGCDLSDFAVVYSYPWPGEDHFHEAAFEHAAAVGAVLLHFRGPNEMAAWRKVRR